MAVLFKILEWNIFRLQGFLLILYMLPFLVHSDISLSSLPEELKPIVREALIAERHFNGEYRDCQKPEVIPCPPSKYQNPTGKCNNVRHALWGNRGTPFLRLLPPAYSDGRSEPRQSVDKQALPSPLDVSATLQSTPSRQHKSVTALLGAWSELLLNDLAITAHSDKQNCCSQNVKKHSECYSTVSDGQCKSYMRTLPALDPDACKFVYRNQLNLATSFLDGSALYGNTKQQTEKLRTYDAGLVDISACVPCQSNALYSAILKEHNRIAINLAQLNRHWSDEIIYLESRRLVTAEIQHITYNEYLPTILGHESIANTDLQLQSNREISKYSSSLRAGVFNEVAISALPALLSMIPGSLINNTSLKFSKMVDKLIKTPALIPNVHLELILQETWDTFSLFIHMGRDHGLPSYPKFLHFCHNDTFPSTNITFEELSKVGIKEKHIKALRNIYKNVEDIDLLVGAILEKPIANGIVGPTINSLLKKQFILLKHSDRFWYENDLPPSSFTSKQIKEIKKITLAGLLCANTEELNKIQPKSFFQEDPYLNAKLPCNQHPLPQLVHWVERNHMADISKDLVTEALDKAEQKVLQRRKRESGLWSRKDSDDSKSQKRARSSFSNANKQALKLANSSLLCEFATKEIMASLDNRRSKRQLSDDNEVPAMSQDELSDSLQNVNISSSMPSGTSDEDDNCDDKGPCNATSPYRTMTGYCNNLANPSYGKSVTNFERFLPSAYDDKISKPRSIGVTGLPLPSPRLISTTIHPDISNLHTKYNMLIAQYGQFVDHDLNLTPAHRIPDCRPCNSSITVHPECFPIPIPINDDYFSKDNSTAGEERCLPFERSLPGQLKLGPREQVNQNSAFFDASQVYGENNCVSKQLRGSGGMLNSTQRPGLGKDLLPQCNSTSGVCFLAGDVRVSEQPGLTVIHTLFMRVHNRVVECMKQYNPHWDAEKLFQEARRVVTAIYQTITYNEFLPRLVGWNIVNRYNLTLSEGYYKGYDPSCNAAIRTEFSTAAYRALHSVIRPIIPRMDASYQNIDPPIFLQDVFGKSDILLQPGMVDEIATGMIGNPMESQDQFVIEAVSNHLFENKEKPFSGHDLTALDIQRGRDHGIASYNKYRAFCNLTKAATFDDLSGEIPLEVIEKFKQIYAEVDDIDLFSGGLSERSVEGGIVGPTFACIIANQFVLSRKCDRFWFENEDFGFSIQQLAELRKSRMSKLICDNLDNAIDIQRSAFDLPSDFLNPRVPCQSIALIDFSAWEQKNDTNCLIGKIQVQVGKSALLSPCKSCTCTHGGILCVSLRITDCFQLLLEWSKEELLRDEICVAQCSILKF